MARLNTAVHRAPVKTAEGAPAMHINAVQQLRRMCLATMLWEDAFYIDGKAVAEAIAETAAMVAPEVIASLAVEARSKQKLRHLPLHLVRELIRHKDKPAGLVADTLANVIQRPDEMGEFLAMYWKEARPEKKKNKGGLLKNLPLPAQVKKGLARAFQKFDAYQLAKWNRDSAIKLKDVMFLVHPKPKDQAQADTWKQLIDGTLTAPDTWEVGLSAGDGKKTDEKKAEVWTRLLKEEKLGGLALLRNLRNMLDSGVDTKLIKQGLESANYDRVLPFRFIAAAQHAPKIESAIEKAFLGVTAQRQKLPGKTILVVDTSGSMYGAGNISKHSDMTRVHAAGALAAIVREICDDPVIYCTAGDDHARQHATALVPDRRGFALVNLIANNEMRSKIGGGGIFLVQCLDYIIGKEKSADRIIVITDEQDCDVHGKNPDAANAFGKRNYLINISVERNGIGYGKKWTHIDGWSEHVLDFIREDEIIQ